MVQALVGRGGQRELRRGELGVPPGSRPPAAMTTAASDAGGWSAAGVQSASATPMSRASAGQKSPKESLSRTTSRQTSADAVTATPAPWR